MPIPGISSQIRDEKQSVEESRLSGSSPCYPPRRPALFCTEVRQRRIRRGRRDHDPLDVVSMVDSEPIVRQVAIFRVLFDVGPQILHFLKLRLHQRRESLHDGGEGKEIVVLNKALEPKRAPGSGPRLRLRENAFTSEKTP